MHRRLFRTFSLIHKPLAALLSVLVLVSGCGSADPAQGVSETEPATTGSAPSPAADPVNVVGDGTTPVGTQGTETAGSGKVCEATERLGSFRLYLSGDRTIFSGAVSSATAPSAIPMLISEAGSCRLLGPQNLFCSTPCISGQVCAGNDQCVAAPEKISAGSILISGAVASIEAKANPITSDYSSSIREPYPGFQPGAPIQLQASGEEAESFLLNASGVPELTSSAQVVSVQSGRAATLTWDVAEGSSGQPVFITFTVNAHGALTGWIECEAPDTGAFDVPSALVTELISLGLSGFPRASLTRRTTDTVALSGGCVDFSVYSELTLDLEIDGLVSCNTDENCPEGSSCSPELACEAPRQ